MVGQNGVAKYMSDNCCHYLRKIDVHPAETSLPESHPILCQAQCKIWNYFPMVATPLILPEFTPESSEYCRNQQMKLLMILSSEPGAS